jgi:hypothetical protein
LKRQIVKGWIACVFGLSVFAHSQASPTATRSGGGRLQIGIGGSAIRNDLNLRHSDTFDVYGTLDLTTHIGIEGDIRLNVISPDNRGMNNYLLGPRYVFHYGRFQPYVKVLGGIGTVTYETGGKNDFTSRHPAVAIGGGLDTRITRHINVRLPDVEYQFWPTFSNTGLNPLVVSAGVAYIF